MEVADRLKFNSFSVGKIKNKCLIFFHGWSGNMDSFIPFAKSSKINNVEWFFPQAPYAIENGYSWSYEISKGVWERDEPFFMIRDFLDSHIFSNYDSKNVYLFGFSQGAMVCYELLKEIDSPLGGVFPIGGFMRGLDESNFVNKAQKNTHIHIGHGKDDEIILPQKSKDAYNVLKKYCQDVHLSLYTGKHKINISYWKKIVSYIENE